MEKKEIFKLLEGEKLFESENLMMYILAYNRIFAEKEIGLGIA